jgi:hypothetical protein
MIAAASLAASQESGMNTVKRTITIPSAIATVTVTTPTPSDDHLRHTTQTVRNYHGSDQYITVFDPYYEEEFRRNKTLAASLLGSVSGKLWLQHDWIRLISEYSKGRRLRTNSFQLCASSMMMGL